MQSKQGAIVFVINIIGNFGTVFLDNGYYNKAIAASPVSALPGYILGGLSWFAVPFLAATTMGLAAIALESNPFFPSYPNRLSADDVLAGLTLPAAAIALMGRKLIYVSHLSVVGFGLLMSGWSVCLYYINIDLGYLYLLMGVLISSAVIPGAVTLLWRRQSQWAACLSPLITTRIQFGSITVRTSGSNIPMLVGNVVALCSPILFVPLLSLVLPDQSPYDFNTMKEIKRDDEDETRHVPNVTTEEIQSGIDLLKRNSRIAHVCNWLCV